MVMGPTHAMSGAFFSLAAITTYTALVGPVHPTIAILGTVMAAGASLGPDIDSNSSTVVRSFGIFGRVAHHIANSIGVAVFTATRTRYDRHPEGGHRTFFHTTFMAILMGGLVALATLPTNIIHVFGHPYSLGQFNAIILMSIFLNLCLSGLLEKRIKAARKRYGPYALMAFSLVFAIVLSIFMPVPTGSYSYLGIAVGFGWFVHLLGDAITKMGVPMAWPVKVAGKRWYDISLPSFMRITAGGDFEKIILLPVLTGLTVLLLIYNTLVFYHILPAINVIFNAVFSK